MSLLVNNSSSPFYKEITFDGGEVCICNSDERIRIYFDDIPNLQTRMMLKSNAFRWSSTNKVWQRQLTPNAMFALKHYVSLPNLDLVVDKNLYEL